MISFSTTLKKRVPGCVAKRSVSRSNIRGVNVGLKRRHDIGACEGSNARSRILKLAGMSVVVMGRTWTDIVDCKISAKDCLSIVLSGN